MIPFFRGDCVCVGVRWEVHYTFSPPNDAVLCTDHFPIYPSSQRHAFGCIVFIGTLTGDLSGERCPLDTKVKPFQAVPKTYAVD